MKLLLIESTPGNANEINASLLADGHEVVTCADEHGGPCRGIDRHVECPMESHIDLTIVARGRFGAHAGRDGFGVCHSPPCADGGGRPAAGRRRAAQRGRRQRAAKRGVEAGYAAAIRHELGHLPALVDVERTPGRVHVMVQVPASEGSPQKLSAVADRARHAVRSHDPYVKGIDVSVVCYPDPE